MEKHETSKCRKTLAAQAVESKHVLMYELTKCENVPGAVRMCAQIVLKYVLNQFLKALLDTLPSKKKEM